MKGVFAWGRWSGGVTRGVTKWCNQLGKGGAEPGCSYFVHDYPCKKRTSLQAGYRLVPYLVTPKNGFVKPFVGLSVTKVTNFYKKRFYKKGYIEKSFGLRCKSLFSNKVKAL